MLKIGEFNTLEVLRKTEEGTFLGGPGNGEVILSPRDRVESLAVGEEIEVFIYRDFEDKLCATTLVPKLSVDTFACLEVMEISKVGAFFDMGLERHLLVPHREQSVQVAIGDKRIVHMFLDEETDRLTGSMKWREFCFTEDHDFKVNQEVRIMIGESTNLGRNVLIEGGFYGLIYKNEIYEDVAIGDIRQAYIKSIREDGDIDVSLQKLGYGRVKSSSNNILDLLKSNNGILDIGDKSSPEKIAALTGMSKKTFKKAIGDLYRKKLVLLEKEQVKLK